MRRTRAPKEGDVARTQQLFVQACKQGDLQSIRSLVNQHNADPNVPDDNGDLPLHTALHHQRWECATTLFQTVGSGRIDASKPDGSGRYPLLTFLSGNPPQSTERLLEFLVEHSADVTQAGRTGTTPLMVAASFDNLPAVHFLLKSLSTDPVSPSTLPSTALAQAVDKVNKHGQTALLIAAEGGCTRSLKELLSKTTQGVEGALEAAVRQKHPNCVSELLAKVPEAAQMLTSEGEELPAIAARNGDRETMKFLLEHGGSVNAHSKGDRTALLEALEHNFTGCAILLIQQGATIDSRVMAAAVDNENQAVIEAVIGRDENVAQMRFAHETMEDLPLLSYLVGQNNIALVERILNESNSKADVNIADETGPRQTPLMIAIEQSHEELIDLLLKQPEIDLHMVNSTGYTALKIAASNGRVDLCERLIRLGASPSDLSVMSEAVTNGHSDVVEMLLHSKGFRMDFEDEEFREVFLLSCSRYGDIECAKHILDFHHEINGDFKSTIFSETVGTALTIAVDEERLPYVQLLATNGADAESLATGLVSCAKQGIYESMATLILCKADVDYCTASGSTPLSAAAKRWGRSRSEDHWQCVRLLVDSGADVSFRDSKEDCVLKWAAIQGVVPLVEKLTKARGVDLNALDLAGWTPLMYAVQAAHLDSVRVLLDAGADVDIVGTDGNTAATLATAAWRMDGTEIPVELQMIFEKSKDISIVDTYGDSITTWAARHGHHDCIEMLTRRDPTRSEAKFNPDAQNRSGHSALYVACIRDHREVAHTLLKNGCNPQVYVSDDSGQELPLLLLAINKGWNNVALTTILRGGAQTSSEVEQFRGFDESLPDYLQLCIDWGWQECVAALIDSGYECHETTDEGLTPLLAAARRGNVIVLAHMLERSSPSAGGREAAVVIAAAHGHAECVLAVVNADDGSLDLTCVETAMHLAAHFGNADMLVSLISIYGADSLNRAIKLSDRILHAMDMHAALATIPELIIALQQEQPMTILMQASRNGHVACVTMLLEYGAHVENRNPAGWNPLLLASLNGHIGVVKELLWWGARVDHVNQDLSFTAARKVLFAAGRLKSLGWRRRSLTPTSPSPTASPSGFVSTKRKSLGGNSASPSSPQLSPVPLTAARGASHSKLPLFGLMKRVERVTAEHLTCDTDIGCDCLPEAMTNQLEALQSPVVAAAHGGHKEVVNLLIEAGSSYAAAVEETRQKVEQASSENNDGAVLLWRKRRKLIESCAGVLR